MLADGRRLAVIAIKRDRQSDLAALQVAAHGLPAAAIGDARGLRPGQVLFAAGHTAGMRGVVTAGFFSTMVQTADGRELVQAVIALRPGNSGGPLADVQGRVVGINTMITGPRLALAIPTHSVTQFLAKIGEQPRLGISGWTVPLPGGAVAGTAGSERWGLLVSTVLPGSPADKAGLLIGDIVLAIDDRPLDSGGSGLAMLSRQADGTPRHVRVLRGGEPRDILVTPALLPGAA